jgi:hypothetical protein
VTYVDNQDLLLEDDISLDELKILYESKLPLLNKAEMENAKRILENQEVDSYHKLHKFLTDKAA